LEKRVGDHLIEAILIGWFPVQGPELDALEFLHEKRAERLALGSIGWP
jgi:hypothetical protein